MMRNTKRIQVQRQTGRRRPSTAPPFLRSKVVTIIEMAAWHPSPVMDTRGVCMHTYIHLFICMYLCIMFVCTYVCICTYVFMCMYVYVCVCVCMYLYVCVCWGDLGVDGWIILGWISRRWDVGMWTGVSFSRRTLHHGVSK